MANITNPADDPTSGYVVVNISGGKALLFHSDYSKFWIASLVATLLPRNDGRDELLHAATFPCVR